MSSRETQATGRSNVSSRATTGKKTATPALQADSKNSKAEATPTATAPKLGSSSSSNRPGKKNGDNQALLDRHSAMLAEEKKEGAALAAQALVDKITLGKKACPKPFIGMRVKLSPEVPAFIRDLTEPAVKYRRPSPLIGTVVKVVGDPMEQKRVHDFKYRRCNQTNRSDVPVAMWCDVQWDAPTNGQEIAITGYHTGRFGLHYLRLVAEEDDPFNDPKNVRLREEKAKQQELREAIAKRVRESAVHDIDTMLPAVKEATGDQSHPASGKNSSGARTPGSGFTPRYWSDSQAATEHRKYHSKEALERGLDPAGKEKALERMVIAHDYWSSHPDEDPNARRLRRYSAGHSPSSSSAVTQESLVASRPCSRGSICSDQIISAHYDEFARPGSRGSVGLSVGSGDGSRPSSRGTHISGGGILRPPSRGGVGLQDEMRPSSGGSVAFNEKIRHRPGSSRTGSVYDSESRPETSGRDAGTLLLGSRPASRANVRFTDGSRPGSAMILGQSKGLDRPASVQRHETAGFDRPESINTFALPEVPSPRSSDSEIEEVLEGENR